MYTEVQTEKEFRTMIMDHTDELCRKRVMLFKITRQNGSIEHQLVIVDPYMTVNIDLTEQTVINMHKSISSIISNKQL